MTFAKFEELFKNRFPDGTVIAHGKFAGTKKNMKTTVIFAPGGRCYSYYGAYEDILCRIGINVISKERLAGAEMSLKRLIEWNGKENFFGGVTNNDAEIKACTEEIRKYKEEYIIV